ncbi:Protein WEAK CHLOROPLAST MOVEMENT UNDER BLUE LIGHT 1 [Heracleum sosnowskyi]|uniref:Protein WEAK CHLOROPLAST MOVEMENT UNDER BLUE LIGHT 1 n=1 Tax=Heracleum sosnowskyi TaxID=360622 RepID=A0AAD8IQK6_9APIA|nr:Protein WEAK CHLOROPLAST MOVEMENT UNDER BLUE LIGHT 1 [Heracleum sosnowskyi]
MTPQQGQGLPKRTQNHEGFVTAAYPKLRVRNDSTDKLSSLEQKFGETEPQESLYIYPQLKVSRGISDEILLEEEASVSSSNSESLTDPRDEENVTSSSEYNSVSEPFRSNYVRQQYVFDLPITVDHDASSTSLRDEMERFEDELMESSSSNMSEAKTKSKLSSLEDGGFVTYAQGRPYNVNKVPPSSSQVLRTESRHSRQISDKVSQALPNRTGQIDKTTPFESAKGVVFTFGGIVDCKAHKVQTVEKRKDIEQELEAVHQELQWFRKQSEAAENDKGKVLKALNSSKRLIEELNLYLERAQMEEHQAKEDSELESLMAVEMEHGIVDKAHNAAKAQFEDAKARNDAALSELETVKEELITVQNDYATLLTEKDLALRKAEEARAASKEIEKTVQELTIELIAARDVLESQHATHLKAEEHKIGAAMALEQDTLNWEKELKQAEEDLEKLDQQILSAKDLKSKLDTASALLQDLNFELAACMDSNLNLESEEHSNGNVVGQDKKTRSDLQTAVSLAKKNLEEVKFNIEETNEEIRLLSVASTSLKSQLEVKKIALTTLDQREGMTSVAIQSIGEELNRTINEIAIVQVKGREAREKMVEMHNKLQKAAEEADQAKLVARAAHEELRKAQEEVEHAKAGARTVQSRLLAAQKEIEASKASESHAIAAITALEETEAAQTLNNDNTSSGVALPLEEYYELSKQAQDAEEQANKRIADALSQVEIAKESELQNLTKMEKVNSKLATQKDRLEFAREKAGKAKEEKLGIEQELRKWRAELEQRRKAGESSPGALIPSKSPRESLEGEKAEAIEKRNLPTRFEVKNEAQYLNKAKSAAAATQLGQSIKTYEPKRSESVSFHDVQMLKKKKKFKILRFFSFSRKKKRNSPSLQSPSSSLHSPSSPWRW